MPLIKSKSRKAVGENIKRLTREGKSRDQAIAIALDIARKSGAKISKKKGRVKR